MFFSNVTKGRQEWYLYVFTIILVAFGYLIGQFPMTMAIMAQMAKYPEIGTDEFLNFQESPDFTVFHISSNIGFILILLIFLFAIFGLYVGVKWIHKRAFRSLINWHEKIDWKRIFWSFGLWMILTLIFEILFYFIEPENYSFQLPGFSFLFLLLITFTLLPIQTSFEEFLFRGYFMQAIGSLARNKWVALIISTLLFAGVHSMNPEIAEYGFWNMLPYYLIAGLFLGYITIMDNGLELALGVHAATNMFGSLFVTYKGAALQTETLFKTTEVNPLLLSVVFLVLSIIFILFATKKFNWPNPISHFSSWEDQEIKNQGQGELAGNL